MGQFLRGNLLRPEKFDINWVRENYRKGENPRVHPNGFIQLDLAAVAGGWHETHQQGHSGASLRLHIWNPPGIELPHQHTVNEVHDHVFDMRSNVVKGGLSQKLYKFTTGTQQQATHELYRAVYGQGADSRLQPLGVFGVLSMTVVQTVGAGESYLQPAFTLHDTGPINTVVTVMEKVRIREGEATVVCPIGQSPDNSFDRASAMPADDIWAAIEAAIA